LPRPFCYFPFILIGLLGPSWLGVGAVASAGFNPTTLTSVTPDLSLDGGGMGSVASPDSDTKSDPTDPFRSDLWIVIDAPNGVGTSNPPSAGSTGGSMCPLAPEAVPPASPSVTRLVADREPVRLRGSLTSILDPPRCVCR
jgi:hypothetical protein